MSQELTLTNELLFDPRNLTKETIKQYLCPAATDQELTMGLQISKTFNLNPLKREVYFVKYGTHPMQVLTGYEVYLKRADRSGKYQGMKDWTEGSLEGKDLKGCVEVYRAGWERPLYHEVDYAEYVQKKADGTVNVFWSTKPKTMIKKVAVSQAFRLAFPDEFDGMPYTSDEVVDQEKIQAPLATKAASSEIKRPQAASQAQNTSHSNAEDAEVYMDIITMLQGTKGAKLNVIAFGISVKFNQLPGAKDKSKTYDITEYTVGDLKENPTATAVIKVFGKPLEVGAGAKIKFHGVEVGEYKNAPQYTAKEATV